MINVRSSLQLSDVDSASLALPKPSGDPLRAASNEVDAGQRLRTMLEDNYDFIWRTLRRLGLDAAAADDAAQNVFVIASRKVAEIRPGGEKPYLFGIAYRVAKDARKSLAHRREQPWAEGSEAVDPKPQPDEILDQRRARAMLDDAPARLPLELRVVFVLHELEELSMSEIARLAQVPAGTVASRLRRARQEFESIVARLGKTARGGLR